MGFSDHLALKEDGTFLLGRDAKEGIERVGHLLYWIHLWTLGDRGRGPERRLSQKLYSTYQPSWEKITRDLGP